jgi:hypothetical protein
LRLGALTFSALQASIKALGNHLKRSIAPSTDSRQLLEIRSDGLPVAASIGEEEEAFWKTLWKNSESNKGGAEQALPSGGMSGTAFFVAALNRRGVPA